MFTDTNTCKFKAVIIDQTQEKLFRRKCGDFACKIYNADTISSGFEQKLTSERFTDQQFRSFAEQAAGVRFKSQSTHFCLTLVSKKAGCSNDFAVPGMNSVKNADSKNQRRL